MREQEIGVEQARSILGKIVDAVALDRITYFLTRRGRRYAAIVPIAYADSRAEQLARVRAKLRELGVEEAAIESAMTDIDWASVGGQVWDQVRDQEWAAVNVSAADARYPEV